jgi:hypothetical protein
MKEIAFLLLVIAVIVLGPFAGIWALNTLFPVLAIPYSLETWAAAIMIKSFLTVDVTKKD